MKKLILLATIFVGLGANAQTGGPGGGRGMGPRMNMDSLYKVWNITDEQLAKLKPAQEAQRAAMQKLREDQDTPREERMEKMKAINEDFLKKRNQIITKEQAALWDAYLESRRGQGRGQRN